MTPTGRKRPSSGAILTSSVATKGPIKVPRLNNNNNKPSNFKEFLKETLREFALGIVIKDCKTIEEEFTTIRTDMIYDSCSKTKIAFDSHSDKNRYQDVICIDKTRVRLAYPPGAGSDYIHANYVMGHDDEMRFICTQGPKENTVNDFWRMVWQEKCKSIVMLCNVMELSKKKCEKYWPDEGIPLKLPSNLTIYFIKKDEVEPHLVVTRLKVENEAGESLELEHIQWKDWPDRGVPVASMAPFRLLTRLQNLTPSVVHCSAGIGRSGTIIGLDLAYNRLLSGQVTSMDSIVRKLREQRHGSVQTDVQYLYMHRLLLLLAEDKGAVTAEELAPFLRQYDQWTNFKY